MAAVTARCRSRLGQRAPTFTLTELLVVVSIVALLCAILLPIFLNVRENGRQTVCLSNMRQLAAALTLYAQDADGYFPTHPDNEKDPLVTWGEQIWPYLKTEDVFRCPDCTLPPADESDMDPTTRGYAMNLEATP